MERAASNLNICLIMQQEVLLHAKQYKIELVINQRGQLFNSLTNQ